MVLETKRLLLRGWRDEDAPSLFKYANDERIGLAAGWAPHKSEAYSRAVIRTILAGRESYAICLKEQGSEIVGSIGLTLKGSEVRPLEDGEAELGFWVGVPFWGQGIATEAAMEIMRHGFENLLLKRIFCGYFEGNEKSKRVQQKCGFTYHHTNPDTRLILLDETRVEHVNVMSSDVFKRMKFNNIIVT